MADEITLGQVLDKEGGDIQTGPFGTKLKAAEYTPEGVPVISVGEVGYGRLRTHTKTPRVDESVTGRMPEYLLRPGDIVFGRKGAVDRSALVLPEQDGWFLGSDGIRIRLPQSCDAAFMSYQLLEQRHRNWIIQHAAGTTMASLNEAIIRSIPVVLPPLPEQRAIAGVLGALDDKIEQNRRTAGKLEELARSVFKAWFVDFAPVHAKANGATSYPGLPQEAFDALPTTFQASPLGQIPEGWEARTIGEVVTIKGGGTPSTKNPEYWEGGTNHWTTPRDLSSLAVPVLLETSRRITQAGVDKISSGMLPEDTVLLSSRAPVGYLAITAMPCAINQGYIAMVCDGPLSPRFILRWAESSMDLIKANASGTTFAEISKKNFKPLPVVVPPPPIADAFDSIVKPLFDLLVASERESKKLADLRDYLLPRLLSGTVRVGGQR